jgi:hypothetical protein
MPAQTADRLVSQAIELYQNQAYAEALDLLTAQGEQYPEQAAMVLYLRSCMATRMAEPELALEILEDAICRGYWYSERLINKTRSWKPLRGIPRFERAVEVGGGGRPVAPRGAGGAPPPPPPLPAPGSPARQLGQRDKYPAGVGFRRLRGVAAGCHTVVGGVGVECLRMGGPGVSNK